MGRFESIKDLFNPKVEESTTKWVFNELQTIKTFRALPYSLGQTVSDLVDNSIDAKGSLINISYEIIDDSPMLTITDNGHGLNDAEIDLKMSFGHERDRKDSELGRFV